MGERVLLARHHRGSRYDLYRTQWAEIGPLIDAATSGRCPIGSAVSPTAQWKQCGRARWAELVDDLDYLSVDLCLRSDPTLVSVYLPVWLGIPTGERDETDSTCGALVRVGSTSELTRLSAWLRREKSRLGRRIERGLSDRRGAQRSLLAELDPEYLSASARHRRDDPE